VKSFPFVSVKAWRYRPRTDRLCICSVRELVDYAAMHVCALV